MADTIEVASVCFVRHHNNTKKKTANKRWTWTDENVKHLISAIVEFKTLCDFNNVDFSSDLITMYNEVRKNLAKEFPEDFGVPSETKASKAIQEMTKEEYKLYKSRLDKEQNLIRKGKERVKEKIKSIRQDFSKAVNRQLAVGKLYMLTGMSSLKYGALLLQLRRFHLEWTQNILVKIYQIANQQPRSLLLIIVKLLPVPVMFLLKIYQSILRVTVQKEQKRP